VRNTAGHQSQRGRSIAHVALVTGGTRGIGRAIALRLAKDGAAVAISGISEGGPAEEVIKEIEKTGVPVMAVRADVGDRKQVVDMLAEVSRELGGVDILVNNAGIFDDDYSSGWTLEENMWEKLYRVNLKGVYLCCAAALPQMIESGWGRIINISSTSGISGGTSGIHYAATKGGVIAMSLALAKEVANRGITVNVIAPSKIDTDMFRTSVKPEDRESVVGRIPVGRLGQPEDVAEAAAYFASEQAGYLTGQTLIVSGGY